MSNVFIMDDQPTNVENLSPSFYIAICILCSVTFDWLWLPRTFILLAMTFQSTRQESPWATKASQAGSTKMSLEVLGWQNVFKCLRGFYWMRLLTKWLLNCCGGTSHNGKVGREVVKGLTVVGRTTLGSTPFVGSSFPSVGAPPSRRRRQSLKTNPPFSYWMTEWRTCCWGGPRAKNTVGLFVVARQQGVRHVRRTSANL